MQRRPVDPGVAARSIALESCADRLQLEELDKDVFGDARQEWCGVAAGLRGTRHVVPGETLSLLLVVEALDATEESAVEGLRADGERGETKGTLMRQMDAQPSGREGADHVKDVLTVAIILDRSDCEDQVLDGPGEQLV